MRSILNNEVIGRYLITRSIGRYLITRSIGRYLITRSIESILDNEVD